jgi:hypothetical protein
MCGIDLARKKGDQRRKRFEIVGDGMNHIFRSGRILDWRYLGIEDAEVGVRKKHGRSAFYQDVLALSQTDERLSEPIVLGNRLRAIALWENNRMEYTA